MHPDFAVGCTKNAAHLDAIAALLEADGKLRDVITAEIRHDSPNDSFQSLLAIVGAADRTEAPLHAPPGTEAL